MKSKVVTQAIITEQASVREHQTVEEIALFNEDGVPYTGADVTYEPVVIGTAIGTAAKTTTADEPKANTFVVLKFTNGNSATTPTVAFNGGTARVIKLAGTAVTAPYITIAAGGNGVFFFDGTVLHQAGAYVQPA